MMAPTWNNHIIIYKTDTYICTGIDWLHKSHDKIEETVRTGFCVQTESWNINVTIR